MAARGKAALILQKLPASTSRHPQRVMTTAEKKAEKKLAETLSRKTHFNMKASLAMICRNVCGTGVFEVFFNLKLFSVWSCLLSIFYICKLSSLQDVFLLWDNLPSQFSFVSSDCSFSTSRSPTKLFTYYSNGICYCSRKFCACSNCTGSMEGEKLTILIEEFSENFSLNVLKWRRNSSLTESSRCSTLIWTPPSQGRVMEYGIVKYEEYNGWQSILFYLLFHENIMEVFQLLW